MTDGEAPTSTEEFAGDNVEKGFVNFYQKHLFTLKLKFAEPYDNAPGIVEKVKGRLVQILKRRVNEAVS
ncbi:MAG: hypothetical protein ACTSU5_09065 [Promethearchaeota archaeon]